MKSNLPNTDGVTEIATGDRKAPTLTDMLPPQCQQDFTNLRRFCP